MPLLTLLPNLGMGGSPIVSVSVALSGTITTAVESDIVAGGETIILTLTDDTWVSAGATFDAQRQNIIDGLDSAGSELTGWNNEVRDKEVVTSVVRTSDTVVTITLSAAADYAVDDDETITITVPASALTTSSVAVEADSTFTITAEDEVIPGLGGVGDIAGGREDRAAAERIIAKVEGEAKAALTAREKAIRAEALSQAIEKGFVSSIAPPEPDNAALILLLMIA